MTMEVEGHLTAIHKKPASSKARWRRAVVTSSVIFSMLIAGSSLVPTILMQTQLRNRVLGTAVKQSNLTVTAQEATGGWLAPLVFKNVRIADSAGRFLCTIRELRTSQGLFGFLTGGPDIGQLDFIEPRVELQLDEHGKFSREESGPSNAQFRFAVQKGSLLVRVPWRTVPILDVDSLELTGNVAASSLNQRTLTLNATQIFDHEPLSEAHANQNLALIAPVLSQSTELRGSASVWLDEVKIPLGGEQKLGFVLRGRAEFHSLEAKLKDTWTRQLAAISSQLSGKEVPDRITVLQDSEVTFEVTDNGIFHEGMVFLLPTIFESIRVTSSGTIHLDESLDLQLAVTMPELGAQENPFLSMLSQLTSEPLRLYVKGTVSDPQLQLPNNTDLLGEISRRVTRAQHTEEAPAVPSAVIELLQGVSKQDKDEAKEALPGNILNLIRAIDHGVKEKAKNKPARSRRESQND